MLSCLELAEIWVATATSTKDAGANLERVENPLRHIPHALSEPSRNRTHRRYKDRREWHVPSAGRSGRHATMIRRLLVRCRDPSETRPDRGDAFFAADRKGHDEPAQRDRRRRHD